MNLATTRFGKIEFDETMVIELKGPILGFEHLTKYIVLKHDQQTPFSWFQSVEDGSLAFVVMNPQVIKSNYEPEIPDEDVSLLDIEDVQDVVLLSIITIRSKPAAMISANLRAPIVINLKKKLGKQIVLEDASLPVQYEITLKHTDEGGNNQTQSTPKK